MSEKRINNTIFLMYLVTENYCKKHNLSMEEFLKLDDNTAFVWKQLKTDFNTIVSSE